MNNKILLKSDKIFKMIDFLKIPFQACPGCSAIICITRIISSLIPALTALATAYFVNTAIAIFSNEKEFAAIFLPLSCYMLIVIYNYLKNVIIFNFVNIRFDMKIFRYFRADMINKRAKLKYEHVENNDTWELINRTSNNLLGSIASGFNGILDIIDLILQVTSVLLIIFTQVWWVALVILALAVPFTLLAVRGGKEVYEADKEAEEKRRRAEYYRKVLSERENVEERSVFAYTDVIKDKWHGIYEVARKISLKVNVRWYVLGRIGSVITLAFTLMILGILFIPLKSGALSIGLFVGIQTSLMDLVDTMSWRLSYVTSEFTKNLQYLKDLTRVMALSEQEGAFDLPADYKKVSLYTIEFENVTFQYPGTERYVLKDFSVKLEKNKHYAFVGVNGAGKTTITKLLTGMYDNYEGNIYINGKNLRDYKLAELKAFFSVVYQDFAKYYITIEDNIRLGNTREIDHEEYDEKNMWELLERIELKNVVEEYPEKLHTYLGKIRENSLDLSGGQWQRLAITRALYNPAKVQILDEPTASLDPVAESKIYQLFGEMSKGKTTIFITHRLGAARLADEIIVLADGKVVEKGSHDELLGADGIYTEMFESQRSWYQYG